MHINECKFKHKIYEIILDKKLTKRLSYVQLILNMFGKHIVST